MTKRPIGTFDVTGLEEIKALVSRLAKLLGEVDEVVKLLNEIEVSVDVKPYQPS